MAMFWSCIIALVMTENVARGSCGRFSSGRAWCEKVEIVTTLRKHEIEI